MLKEITRAITSTPPLLEKGQKIYDAVHGFIRFNAIECKLIDSEPFQRLHYLHQLGIAYMVFPGATHTRFEHSLGTMELATQIFERITRDFSLEKREYWLQIIRLAALCHDLGHLPFSHDAEKLILADGGHEDWTLKVIQSEKLEPVWQLLLEIFPGEDVANDVAKMAIGEKKLPELVFSPTEKMLSQVITGDFFGADRIDYLLRDAQCTGVSYGLFDYHQLIEMLCVIPSHGVLGIEENGIASSEALLLARHFMHRRVYQYSSVKACKFHLARFMKDFYSAISLDLDTYLSFSDSEITTALRAGAKAGHFDAKALLNREMRFKAISLKEGIKEEELEKFGIPCHAYFYEGAQGKGSSQIPSFSVLTRSGAVVPASECSQISIIQKPLSWCYVSPEFAEHFRTKGGG